MGNAVNAELVGDALLMAFQRRRPDQRVVHHSDRGAVYTSLAFSTRLAELQLDQSFGAVGSCYDCETVNRRQAAWLLLTTDPAVWVSLLLICRPPGGPPNTVLAGPVVTS